MLISEKLVERISEYTAPYSAIPNNRAYTAFFLFFWKKIALYDLMRVLLDYQYFGTRSTFSKKNFPNL